MAKNYTFLPQKWPKKLFSKNAAQLEIFFNISQYFLVFWEKVVSIVVSILTFFLQNTVVITGKVGDYSRMGINLRVTLI